MKKYNCNPRKIVTLEGEIYVLERVLMCSNPECAARDWSFHSEELQAMAFWRRIYGVDVIARIADLKHRERKTHDEILEYLHSRGINISKGNITYVLNFVEAVARGWHEENIEVIRSKIKERGGYTLGVDGTHSYLGYPLYIFRDTLSGAVLYARAAASESTDDLKPFFEKVLEMFGEPLAVVSDMQPSILEVVKELLPGVKHQFCQYHFLRNVGKELMGQDYKKLSRIMRREGVKTKVRTQIRGEKKKKKGKSSQT
nr:hypothetical protein [Candidatus Freyarchaeota archaeon]